MDLKKDSKKLPLLKLPFLAQRLVLFQTDPIEILEMSFLSKRLKRTIQSSKPRLELINYYFTIPEQMKIIVQTSLSTQNQVLFDFKKELENGQKKIMNGKETLLRRNRESFTLKCEQSVQKNAEKCEFLIQYLKNLFTVNNTCLQCYMIFPKFSFYERIKPNQVELQKVHLSVEDGRKLLGYHTLERLKFDESKVLTGGKREHFQLNVRSLNVFQQNEWLAFSSFLTMKCEVICLTLNEPSRPFNSTDLSSLVLAWYNGKLENFKSFEMSLDYEAIEESFRNQVFAILDEANVVSIDHPKGRRIIRKDEEKAGMYFFNYFHFRKISK
ncbi:hypothetical protein GCK72_001569 [Caenorhabditis remanei]|uniref:F-box domain-containing protein n=1 Tax=Caenorhabditis remanei TaxID=31234 RepID=A0A6A5HVH4_CAERE|nr:hypothetical protein GCK72_001569 [Caenorhabditis remanei]KAF1769752.1 hypothetical protein GCK72_001569 [Caenorhabditis remanei]